MSLDSEPSVVPAIVLSDLTIVEQGTEQMSELSRREQKDRDRTQLVNLALTGAGLIVGLSQCPANKPPPTAPPAAVTESRPDLNGLEADQIVRLYTAPVFDLT